MAKAAANGIHIEYETFGDSAARPLLLVGGLADQLIHWDDELCKDLSDLSLITFAGPAPFKDFGVKPGVFCGASGQSRIS